MEKGEVEAGVKIVNLLKAGKGATMKSVFIFFCSIIISTVAPAQRTDQQRKVDSLLSLLQQSKPDTSRAMLLLTLASWYETNNQDSSAYYLQKGKELAESLKFEGEAVSRAPVGRSRWQLRRLGFDRRLEATGGLDESARIVSQETAIGQIIV